MKSRTKLISLATFAAASAGLLVVAASSRAQSTTRPASAGPTTIPSAAKPANSSPAPATRPGALAGAPTTRGSTLAGTPTTRSSSLAGAPTTRTSPLVGGLGGAGLRGTTGTIGGGTGGTTGMFGQGRTGPTTRAGSGAGTGSGSTGLFNPRNSGNNNPRNSNSSQRPPASGGDTMTIPTPPRMTQAYADQFAQRSIFQRGLPPVAPQIVVEQQQVGPDPNLLYQQQQDAARARLERSLIFNGVSVENNVPIAFIEDISTFTVTRVHEHDFIGRGTVGKISLSTLQYIVGNRVSTIEIGNSLAGQAYLRSATTPSQLEINELQQSIAATQKSGDTSLSGDDLLTQMKLRRLQELGTLSLPENSATTQPAATPDNDTSAPDEAPQENP